MTSADCLVLLSDIDGLYTMDPNRADDARFIERDAITPEIEAMAAGRPQEPTRGWPYIAAGALRRRRMPHASRPQPRHPLKRIEAGARCTWFLPASTPVAARKQWIAGTLRPAGAVRIDDGALRALGAGKSLLPAGVTGALGQFERGDTVSVVSAGGLEVARGITAYSHADTARIMGRRSADIEQLLISGRVELIHRDDLVILAGQGPAPAESEAESVR
jgi:glutamate 5-kinase